ncbi:Protein TIFY 10c [Dichanthelium oligosanthes]|uniref:Protein TIFY n=1 Tax=Dichanthelium oligosanthes TaxID=888268 RepID=A0A1E5W022_9POAL|nr:Protein TIFY 10c [Dichanthelium oligosanthes]
MGAEKEEQGAAAAAAAMAGRAPAREKSSFAVTCSRLSQYLKEKKGGLQGLGGLGMAPPPAAAGAFRPPTTMNLLSALDAPAAEEPNDAAKATTEEAKGHDQMTAENPREAAAGEEEAQQLTIFYGGKVVVFDKFPFTKVKDLLQIVSTGGDGDTAALPQSSQTSLSDLPIARRNSLHRFLEKRKGRITAKAPYQVKSSVGVEASKQATGEKKKSWLGLGQEAVTVKQEI